MKKGVLSILLLLLAGIASAGEYQMPADLQKLFHKPVAMVDQSGAVLLSRRATGHPITVDWNGDGKNDIILGAKQSMNTGKGEIYMLENVGTSKSPKFKWPARKLMLEGGQPFSCGCG